MESTTILNKTSNMYMVDDFSDITNQNLGDLNNKLFCTFTTLDNLDTLLSSITGTYNIMYNKIFVLYVKENDEYVCTYNIDQGNMSDLPENTILVHRKKETNTLYKNSVLLTQHDELKQLKTKIHKIIEL